MDYLINIKNFQCGPDLSLFIEEKLISLSEFVINYEKITLNIEFTNGIFYSTFIIKGENSLLKSDPHPYKNVYDSIESAKDDIKNKLLTELVMEVA